MGGLNDIINSKLKMRGKRGKREIDVGSRPCAAFGLFTERSRDRFESMRESVHKLPANVHGIVRPDIL